MAEETRRYVVMGAGEVGFHLARSLSQEGHSVVVVELSPERRSSIEEELDVMTVLGNGAHVPVLEAASVKDCDLFLAVSSNDEANLTASLLAKHLGATRSVVRVGVAGEVIGHRQLYEDVFGVDLLLSTQMLTTSRILNHIRGLSTVAVEYFADGKVQLRKISLGPDSVLVQSPLREVRMPKDSLVVAYFRGEELIIPSGDDRARPEDDALVLGKTDVIGEVEELLTSRREHLGTVILAGAGETGVTVARALAGLDVEVRIIERDRMRAREVAAQFPRFEVLHGDATDLTLLKSERCETARCFVALTGNDDTNLMASLLAQEIGIPQVIPMVQRAETTRLWRRLGLTRVFSPRALAYDRIHEYIESGYSSNIVTLSHGAALVVERRLYAASPAAGVSLADINPPRGMIVGAVVRGSRVFVPRGEDRLEEGDLIILFVREEELSTVQLLFPGRDTPR